MSTQTIKAEIINNVLVAMSLYIMEQQTLTILQNVMQQELVRVNMEEITTLPAERKDDISQRNQYIIQLFLIKKRDLIGIYRGMKSEMCPVEERKTSLAPIITSADFCQPSLHGCALKN